MGEIMRDRLYFFYHNRILRIWCWIYKHDYSKPFAMYGIFPVPEKTKRIVEKLLMKGEIRQLYGVRFIRTSKSKGVLHA